jgi:hypothetical protein
VSRPSRSSPHAPPDGRGLEAEERTDRAQEGQEDACADVVVGDGDVKDKEDDQDDRERGSRADPGRGVDVGPALVRIVTRSSPMPAQSVDPCIDEERQHEPVEGAAHDDPGEEREDELEPAHPANAKRLTARTYPVGGAGSRCGSDQRAVMPSRVRATGVGFYSADWAMSSG